MKYLFMVFVTLFTLSANAQTAAEYFESGLKKDRLQDFKGAIEDYNKAIEINPIYQEVYVMRGSAKYLLGDFYAALRDFNKAIDINPKYAVAFYLRGEAKISLQDFSGAIQDLNMALILDQKLGDAVYFIRGSAKMQIKDYQGSIDDFTKAIELNVNYADAYITRSIAKSHLNNFAGAIEDVNKAIAINPGNEKARNLLKETNELKRTSEALQILKDSQKKTPVATEKTEQDASIFEIKDNSKAAIGTMAPDFTQADVNGKLVSLSSFKGNYVLLQFWASWSDPSTKENQFVIQAYNNFSKKNFKIISISLDGAAQKDKWEKAIKDQDLVWTQLCDFKGWNNEVAQLYHVTSIPMNFLLNPDGKIVATNLRGDLLNFTLLNYDEK
ncbi:hypothetical protein BH11BAC3_BH11BAC3_28650 [soil metagenome]